VKTPNLGVSKLQVLQVISDQTSMDIITAISINVTNSGNLMNVLDISYNQYYDRSSSLFNIGLISRKNGQISLTSFGQLIYKVQLKIATAFTHSSELRMIDAIKSYSGMSEDELKRIIDKLLDVAELKDLITCRVD
jgi:hypothetical protein